MKLTGDTKTETPDAEKPLGRTVIRVEVARIEHPSKFMRFLASVLEGKRPNAWKNSKRRRPATVQSKKT